MQNITRRHSPWSVEHVDLRHKPEEQRKTQPRFIAVTFFARPARKKADSSKP